MNWENRTAGGEDTCIYIGDGQEPYKTEDTTDLDDAIDAFIETYDAGNYGEFDLRAVKYVEGEQVDGRIVPVRCDGKGGIERCN